MEKTCIRCSKTCDLSFFHKNSREKDKLNPYCKTCASAAVRKWNKNNRYKKWIGRKPYIAYKKEVCEECGFVPKHSCQLDVDHIDSNHKNNDPTNLRTLCANCHRLKTHTDRIGTGVAVSVGGALESICP